MVTFSFTKITLLFVLLVVCLFHQCFFVLKYPSINEQKFNHRTYCISLVYCRKITEMPKSICYQSNTYEHQQTLWDARPRVKDGQHQRCSEAALSLPLH